MWLLNVHTLQLEEFFSDIPAYIILSHRWRDDELSFKALGDAASRDCKGYEKVATFCRMIRQRRPDVRYGWADCCCIDKTNSTELSEAINSMYGWYEAAQSCYAFLDDVGDKRELARTEWFTRGWTLQELLAPDCVEFFDRDWDYIGSKDDLRDQIAIITGISSQVLQHPPSLAYASVADRFSWAARRKTTRVEDQAYCLLGLFNVNMPLIYGEGERAFYRLQAEIISSTNDLTIFSWHTGYRSQRNSLLAKSVSCFARDISYPQSMLTFDDPRLWQAPVISGGITISNVGISITLLVLPYFINTYLVPVCSLGGATRLCMIVSRNPDYGVCYKTTVDGCAVKTIPDDELVNATVKRLVFAPGLQMPDDISSSTGTYGFWIRDISHDLDRLTARIICRSKVSGDSNYMLMQPGQWGAAGILYLQRRNAQPRCIVFGYDLDFKTTLLAFRPDLALEKRLQTSRNFDSLELRFPKLCRRSFYLESQLDWIALISILKERLSTSIEDDGVALYQVDRTVQFGKPIGKMLKLADYVTLRIYSVGMMWNSELQTVHVYVSAAKNTPPPEQDNWKYNSSPHPGKEAWEVADFANFTKTWSLGRAAHRQSQNTSTYSISQHDVSRF